MKNIGAILVVIGALLAVALVARDGEDSPAAVSAKVDTTERAGRPAVYRRIERITDCSALQDEFVAAMEDVERYPGGDERRRAPLAYAQAADVRLQQLGCYG